MDGRRGFCGGISAAEWRGTVGRVDGDGVPGGDDASVTILASSSSWTVA